MIVNPSKGTTAERRGKRGAVSVGLFLLVLALASLASTAVAVKEEPSPKPLEEEKELFEHEVKGGKKHDAPNGSADPTSILGAEMAGAKKKKEELFEGEKAAAPKKKVLEPKKLTPKKIIKGAGGTKQCKKYIAKIGKEVKKSLEDVEKPGDEASESKTKNDKLEDVEENVEEAKAAKVTKETLEDVKKKVDDASGAKKTTETLEVVEKVDEANEAAKAAKASPDQVKTDVDEGGAKAEKSPEDKKKEDDEAMSSETSPEDVDVAKGPKAEVNTPEESTASAAAEKGSIAREDVQSTPASLAGGGGRRLNDGTQDVAVDEESPTPDESSEVEKATETADALVVEKSEEPPESEPEESEGVAAEPVPALEAILDVEEPEREAAVEPEVVSEPEPEAVAEATIEADSEAEAEPAPEAPAEPEPAPASDAVTEPESAAEPANDQEIKPALVPDPVQEREDAPASEGDVKSTPETTKEELEKKPELLNEEAPGGKGKLDSSPEEPKQTVDEEKAEKPKPKNEAAPKEDKKEKPAADYKEDVSATTGGEPLKEVVDKETVTDKEGTYILVDCDQLSEEGAESKSAIEGEEPLGDATGAADTEPGEENAAISVSKLESGGVSAAAAGLAPGYIAMIVVSAVGIVALGLFALMRRRRRYAQMDGGEDGYDEYGDHDEEGGYHPSGMEDETFSSGQHADIERSQPPMQPVHRSTRSILSDGDHTLQDSAQIEFTDSSSVMDGGYEMSAAPSRLRFVSTSEQRFRDSVDL